MIGDLIVGYWKQKKAKDGFLGDTGGGLTACRREKERLMVQAAMLWGDDEQRNARRGR